MKFRVSHKKNSNQIKATAKNMKERNKLAVYEGEDIRVLADFTCFGRTTLSHGVPKETILLQNLRMNKEGRIVNICEHIWVKSDEVLNLEKMKKNLTKGTTINITARPYAYYREYREKIRGVKYGLGNVNILSVASAN